MTPGRLMSLVAVAALVAAGTSACGGSTAKDMRALDSAPIPSTLTVTSPAFGDGGPIPRANTCDGTGMAPMISWGAVPAHTKTVAVAVDDPGGAKGDFLHWLVIGLAPTAGHVPSQAAGVSELDNTGGTTGWTPPCPPVGSTHRYQFTVYALSDYVCADNGDSSNGPGCSPPSSSHAIPQILGDALARGVLVGTYKR